MEQLVERGTAQRYRAGGLSGGGSRDGGKSRLCAELRFGHWFAGSSIQNATIPTRKWDLSNLILSIYFIIN